MKVLILLHCLTLSWATLTQKYTIRQAWNGELLEEKDYVEFSIGTNADNDGVEIEIKAPFYDDPPPPNATEGSINYSLEITILEFFTAFRRGLLWSLGLRSRRSLFLVSRLHLRASIFGAGIRPSWPTSRPDFERRSQRHRPQFSLEIRGPNPRPILDRQSHHS